VRHDFSNEPEHRSIIPSPHPPSLSLSLTLSIPEGAPLSNKILRKRQKKKKKKRKKKKGNLKRLSIYFYRWKSGSGIISVCRFICVYVSS